ILASRTALAVDPENLSRALELAEPGLRTLAALQPGFDADGASIEELIAVTDTHVGTPEQVAESLAADASLDRKSTRLNSSHVSISYAVFCLKKKKPKKKCM